MKNNFTITKIVMPKIITILLLFLLVLGISNIIQGDVLFEEQEYKKLINVADSKAFRITDFLEQKKSDAVFLSETEGVKDIFNMELIISEKLVEEKINYIAKKTQENINEFLINNPSMTAEDLQKSSEFRELTIKKVGETGYTFTLNTNTFTNHLHNSESRINFEYSSLENNSKSLFDVLKKMQRDPSGNGFYERIEEGGIRLKYLSFYEIPTKTKDGIKLSVASTTYLDEYTGSVELAPDVHGELIDFQKNKGYDDFMLIDPSGNVIWTAKHNNELGTNLITGPYRETILANVFSKAKKDLGVGISDSEEYETGELSIFITSPIFELNESNNKKELIGVVALKLDNKKIQDLVTEDVGLGKKGEVYIINRDYNHITPLMYGNHATGHNRELYGYDNENAHRGEIVKSERIDECFDDYNNYYLLGQGHEIKEVSKSGIYSNYANPSNKVIGAHSYILESGWCVIAENSYKEFKDRIPNENLFLIIVLSILFIFSLTSTIVLDYFFKTRRGKKIK